LHGLVSACRFCGMVPKMPRNWIMRVNICALGQLTVIDGDPIRTLVDAR
jgi:hypothetical protein